MACRCRSRCDSGIISTKTVAAAAPSFCIFSLNLILFVLVWFFYYAKIKHLIHMKRGHVWNTKVGVFHPIIEVLMCLDQRRSRFCRLASINF